MNESFISWQPDAPSQQVAVPRHGCRARAPSSPPPSQPPPPRRGRALGAGGRRWSRWAGPLGRWLRGAGAKWRPRPVAARWRQLAARRRVSRAPGVGWGLGVPPRLSVCLSVCPAVVVGTGLAGTPRGGSGRGLGFGCRGGCCGSPRGSGGCSPGTAARGAAGLGFAARSRPAVPCSLLCPPPLRKPCLPSDGIQPQLSSPHGLL